MADLFSSGIGAAGDLFGGVMGGISDFQAAGGYKSAAKLATQSAALSGASTRIQFMQEQRKIYQVTGGQQADIAASGLKMAGSALDIIRSSAEQASLSKQLIERQGEITTLGFKAQATAYSAQASASETSGIGSIVGGVLGAASLLIGI